jgi:hypothetical protein
MFGSKKLNKSFSDCEKASASGLNLLTVLPMISLSPEPVSMIV